MIAQKNNGNSRNKNWRQLEYEQIIASIHNIEMVEVAVAVFILPVISWGLTLRSSGEGALFCIQEIKIIGIISIVIWLIYMGCYIATHYLKVEKLLKRARSIYNSDKKNQNTHISILSRYNIFNYSLLFKLIGFIICIFWILKYKLLLPSIICALIVAIGVYWYICKTQKNNEKGGSKK